MAAGSRGDGSGPRDEQSADAQFLALRERARNLGWTLVDEGTGYLLRPFGHGIAVACTSSVASPDSGGATDPPPALESVSRMLDQIEAARSKPPRRAPR
jgi:hypothetical protein